MPQLSSSAARLLLPVLFSASPLAAQAPSFSTIVQRATAATRFAEALNALPDTTARHRLTCFANAPARSGVEADALIAFGRGQIDTSTLEHPPSRATLELAIAALKTECPAFPLATKGVAFNVAPKYLAPAATGASVGSSLVGLGAQNAIVQGLTTFLMNRARDELVLAFLENMRTSFAGKDTLLIPATWLVLKQVDAVSYGALVPAFRASLALDLDSLPLSLVDNFAAPGVDASERALFRIGIRAAMSLRAGSAPAAVLADLARLDPTTLPDAALRVALIRIGVLAREYRQNADALRQLTSDENGRRYLLTYFVADELGAKRLADANAALAFWQSRSQDVFELLDRLHDLQGTVDAVRSARNDTTGADAYAAVLRQTTRTLASASNLLSTDDTALRDHAERMLGYANTASDIYGFIAQRDYQEALLTTLRATSQLHVVMPAGVEKYLGFGATLASARSADDVTKALESAALPVTSYRTKRAPTPGRSGWSVTVNGYVGVGGGGEWVRSAGSDRGAGYFGASLPVGLEVSRWFKATTGKRVGRGSIGLLVPLIDLGTIASARLSQSDTVHQEAEVGFAQVFAPGLYLVTGLSSSYPITLGVGAQLAPQLRETTDGKRNARRVGAFLAADVPLFRF